MRNLFAVIIILLLISCNKMIYRQDLSLDQNLGGIEGHIFCQDYGPTEVELLQEADVFLEGTMFGIQTDENGYYIIHNIPPGTYTLRAVYVGFPPTRKEITIKGGLIGKQDLTLVSIVIE